MIPSTELVSPSPDRRTTRAHYRQRYETELFERVLPVLGNPLPGPGARGLFYFLDAEGPPPTQLEWFMKLWWPHLEALYAHLLNYALTGREEDWVAFEQVHDYTFDRFPDPEHGG